MIRKRIPDLDGRDIPDYGVYDGEGRQLVKTGAEITGPVKAKLEEFGIPFIYIKDDNVKVKTPFNPQITAELHRVMSYFSQSKGESADLLKKYSDDQVKKFLSYNKESGERMAFGQVFGYFVSEMAGCLKAGSPFYDFLDFRNIQTYINFHPVSVCCISLCVGKKIGLSGSALKELGIGALLCDHKMGLYKFCGENRGLDHIEMEEMSQHTYLAFDALRKIYGMPAASALVAYQHHERFNGSGYPKKLTGDNISLFSRITSVADVYDSLMSNRPFREALRPEQAWEYIVENSGILFDPQVVEAFRGTIGRYLPGDLVELDNGDIARVLENNAIDPEQPFIKLIEKKDKSVIIAGSNREILRTIESIR